MTRTSSLFFVTLLACGGSNATPTTPLPEPAPPDAAVAAAPPPPPAAPPPLDLKIPAAQATLKLVKPGTGKKQVVKLALAAGKQHVELALDFAGNQKAPAVLGGDSSDTAPTLVLPSDVEIGDVGSDGMAAWKLTIGSVDARVRDGSKTPLDKFKTSMEGVVGLVVSGTVGPDGKLGDIAMHLDKAERQMLNAVALVKLLLMPLWPMLPADPIGVGAKWTVTGPFKIADKLDTTETVEFELASHKGNDWVINATIKLAGADTKVDAHTAFQKIGGSGKIAMTLTDGVAVPASTSTLASDFTALVDASALGSAAGSAAGSGALQAQFHLDQGFAVTTK